MLTDPAVMARVHETIAQRVLAKNVLTATVFPVMDNHVHSEENDQLLVVEIAPLTVTVHRAQIVRIVQDMQIVVSVESALRMVTVHSVESVRRMVIVPSVLNVLPTATVLTGENVPVTVIVMEPHVGKDLDTETVIVHLEESVLPMETAMAHLVEIVHIVPQGTVPPMVIVGTAMHVQNAAVLVGVAPAVLLVENVQAEIAQESHHLENEMVVQNVPSVHPTVTVHSVESALLMEIVVHVLNVLSVLPTEIVHNVEIDPHMGTAMARLVETVPAMVTAGHALIVAGIVPYTETVAPVRNAPSAPAMVIDHNVATVHPMETVVHVQTVVEIALPTEIAQSVPALVTVVAVQTELVLRALVVVMTALLASKNQNSLKNSVWRANFAWFALTTMTRGSMTMSPVMSSIRSLAMN